MQRREFLAFTAAGAAALGANSLFGDETKGKAMNIPNLTLNNGVSVPMLGLGTWLIADDKVAGSVRSAIGLGYRHIDTAQAYRNERGVGEALRGAIEVGEVKRSELFVTTKVAAEHKDYGSAARSIDESLAKSGLEYFDLMIIHSPQPWKEVNQSSNRYEKGNLEAYRALEDALAAGKVRAIGVSNFLRGDLENILAHAKVRPAVNQILAHVGNTPFELIEFCHAQNIAVEAYSPLGHGEIIKNPQLIAMAQTYGASAAQLAIKYCLQLGLIALPKASSAKNQAANAKLDFEISKADMDALKKFAWDKDYGKDGFFPVFGGKM